MLAYNRGPASQEQERQPDSESESGSMPLPILGSYLGMMVPFGAGTLPVRSTPKIRASSAWLTKAMPLRRAPLRRLKERGVEPPIAFRVLRNDSLGTGESASDEGQS